MREGLFAVRARTLLSMASERQPHATPPLNSVTLDSSKTFFSSGPAGPSSLRPGDTLPTSIGVLDREQKSMSPTDRPAVDPARGRLFRIVPDARSYDAKIPAAHATAGCSENAKDGLASAIPRAPGKLFRITPPSNSARRPADTSRFSASSSSFRLEAATARVSRLSVVGGEVGKETLVAASATNRCLSTAIDRQKEANSRIPPMTSRSSSHPATTSATPPPGFSYREPLSGNPQDVPVVKYTTSPTEADALIATLRGDVLAFDLEWPPYEDGRWDAAQKKYTFAQGRTSLVQISDGKTVVLFHVLRKGHPGPGLVSLLADPKRLKLGVAVRGDALKLVRDFPAFSVHLPAGLLELSALVRVVEPDRWTGNRLISLAKLTMAYLGQDLDKAPVVRKGAWDKKLDQEQIDYAINDVVASQAVYDALMARATQLGIVVDVNALGMSVPEKHVPHSPTPSRPPPPPRVLIETEDASLPPKPYTVPQEHYSAYIRFLSGTAVPAVAAALGVKDTVAQSYILSTAQALPFESVDQPTRRRLLECVARGTWVESKYAPFLSRMRRSLDTGGGSGGTSASGPGVPNRLGGVSEVEEAMRQLFTHSSTSPHAPARSKTP